MQYEKIAVPKDGQRITINPDASLNVPDNPIIAFIEGDGIGIDITPVMLKVVNAAVEKAYGGKRKISWVEVFAGDKADEALRHRVSRRDADALRDFVVSIKGPLGTPVGGGMRSLNVAMRQNLDLYACVRPIRYFPGVSTPMADASLTDMVVFRENTEDIYAGIEWPTGSAEVQRLIHFLQNELKVTRHPFSGELGHRHQAGVERGQPAPGAQGHPVRHRERPRVGDAGAQGQHHEVHRRCLHAVGLSTREGGIRRAAHRRGPVAAPSRTRSTARTSSSRT